MGREPSVIALPDGIETPERQLRVLLKHVVPHGSGNSARKRSVIRSLARSGRHAEPRTGERVVSLWAMRSPSSNAASWHAVEFACGVIPMDAAIALGTAMATVALSDRMATPSPITCMTALCPTFRPRGADHRGRSGQRVSLSGRSDSTAESARSGQPGHLYRRLQHDAAAIPARRVHDHAEGASGKGAAG
jgi:hypothetical protein